MTDLQKAKEKYYKQISKYIFGVDSEHPASVYIKELEKSNAEMLEAWIDINDKYPPENEEGYLVYIKNDGGNGGYYAIGFVDLEMWNEDMHPDCFYIPGDEDLRPSVTHWAKLLEPPK